MGYYFCQIKSCFFQAVMQFPVLLFSFALLVHSYFFWNYFDLAQALKFTSQSQVFTKRCVLESIFKKFPCVLLKLICCFSSLAFSEVQLRLFEFKFMAYTQPQVCKIVILK